MPKEKKKKQHIYYSMELFQLTERNVDKWFDLYDQAEPLLIQHFARSVEKLEATQDLLKHRKATLSSEWNEKKANGQTKMSQAAIDAEIGIDETVTELRRDRGRLTGKVKELESIMWALQRRHDRAKMFKDHELRIVRQETD